MSAARYNITIDQGSDYAETFTMSLDDVVVDLTGYSARAQMRKSALHAEVAATFVCTIPDPATGAIHMKMPHAISSAAVSGNFVYDLEIFTAGDAAATRLIYGDVNLTPEVTRP